MEERGFAISNCAKPANSQLSTQWAGKCIQKKKKKNPQRIAESIYSFIFPINLPSHSNKESQVD